MSLRAALLLVPALVLAACGGGGADRDGRDPSQRGGTTPRSTSPGAPPRSASEHLDALQAIADANGGNRAAGSPGDAASRAYVAARLQAAGWTVREEPVSFAAFEERRPPRVTGLDDAAVETLAHSGSGRVRGRPVRAGGFGCTDADWRVVPRGAVAVVDRGTCTFAAKVRRAQARGAAALVVVSRTGLRGGTIGGPGIADVPAVLVTGPAAAALERRAAVTVDVDAFSGRRRTANVVASREGTGRVVTAGAHLDSVPAGAGANDNATGVAALLRVAEQLGRTRRPVTLGFWGAEEVGLVGSRAHVRRLGDAGRRRVAVHVNLDMVGTPSPRPSVTGGTRALRATLTDALRSAGVPGVRARPGADGGSDHASFARAGIPAAFVHTGLDRCYHRRCDRADAVDRIVLRRVSVATTEAVRELAGAR